MFWFCVVWFWVGVALGLLVFGVSATWIVTLSFSLPASDDLCNLCTHGVSTRAKKKTVGKMGGWQVRTLVLSLVRVRTLPTLYKVGKRHHTSLPSFTMFH